MITKLLPFASVKGIAESLLIGALASIFGIGCGSAFAAEGKPEFDQPILMVRQGDTSPPKPYLFDALEDQMPLDHAGKLSFKPSTVELGVNGWAGGQAATVRARLWFNAKGQPLQCDVIHSTVGWNLLGARGWDFSAFGAAVCREFMAKANFTFATWFSAPMRKGFLDREIKLTRWLAPNIPVRFVPRREGYPVHLKVGPEASDGCEISWLRIIEADNVRAICSAFRETEQAKRLEKFRSGSEQATYEIAVYLSGQLRDGGAVEVSEFHDGIKYQAVYQEPKIKEKMIITNSDGDFSFLPSVIKLPIQDDRKFSGRVKVLLKISPEGQVASCQPVFSDTEPRIDNATCEQMANTGSFKFLSPPNWKGYRYLIQSIRWNVED